MLLPVCEQHRKAWGLTTWSPSGSGKQGVHPREVHEHCRVGFWGGYKVIPVSKHQRVALFTATHVCGWELSWHVGTRNEKSLTREDGGKGNFYQRKESALALKRPVSIRQHRAVIKWKKREQAGASSNLSPGGPGGQIGNPVHSFFFLSPLYHKNC